MQMSCQGNPTPSSCNTWFQKEQVANPQCFKCLSQFIGPDAYAKCLAPYIDTTCNHELTCALDCYYDACLPCPQGQMNQCQNQVFSGGGTCISYIDGLYCALNAQFGPGSFCFSGGNDYGVWLHGVGGHYCGIGTPPQPL